MQKTPVRLMQYTPLIWLALGLLAMILLTGCASRDVGLVVQTPEAQKPPIPVSVRTLPKAATMDLEQLLLKALSN